MLKAEDSEDTRWVVDADVWHDPLISESPEIETSQFSVRETVTFSAGQAWKRAVLNILWMPTFCASLVGGIGFIMAVGFAVAGLLPDVNILIQLSLLPAMLFGITWLMTLVIAIPLCLMACVLTKQRTIRIERGKVIQATGFRTTTLPLDQSCWHVTDRASDLGGRYFGYGTLVQIQQEDTAIVCGFSDEAQHKWVLALQQSPAQQVLPTNRRRAWLSGLAVSVLTGAIGAGIGLVASRFSANPFILASCTMIGMLDGAMFSLGYFYWARRGTTAVRGNFGPLMCSLMFMATAAKFSAGLKMLVCGTVVNGGIGWFCGRYITAYAKKFSEEKPTPRE